MTRRYFDMNQHDALYTVARKYPGGVDALARALDMSPNVLRNKLAPTISSHHVTFEEVSLIVDCCHKAGVGDAHLPLHALLVRHGRELGIEVVGAAHMTSWSAESELDDGAASALRLPGGGAQQQSGAGHRGRAGGLGLRGL